MRLRTLPDILPLLTKELIEQSARRRTYITRTLYLTGLFCGAGLIFYEMSFYRSLGGPTAMLGAGRDLFMALMIFQFVGTYVFVPLISSGLITSEKERDSLSLLFLTRLGPWTIVLEKILGRLVPLCLFYLGSLPLMAVAYSLGGVTTEMLAAAIWSLGITAFQCVALAVMCSAWCRSTVAAFFTTVAVGFLLIAGPPFLDGMRLIEIESITIQSVDVETEFLFMGPYLYFGLADMEGFLPSFLASGPLVLSGLVSLVLSRVFLTVRAFSAGSNLLKRGFQGIDGIARQFLPRRLFELLIRDTQHLPDQKPVAWRETGRSLTGSTRYQFYMFLLTMVPLVLLCLWVTNSEENVGWSFDMLVSMHFLLWIAAALIVSVKSASLFSSERSRQTFDVLMTTPMETRDILRQKMSSVRQLILFLMLVFFTLFLFEASWRDEQTRFANARYWGLRDYSTPTYLACCALTVTIYLPMIAWVSLAIGLRSRSHVRAIFGSVICLFLWCIGPLILVGIIATLIRQAPNNGLIWLVLGCPAAIIPFNEFSDLDEFAASTIVPVIANSMLYGTILFVVRAWCLQTADAAIGRPARANASG